MNTVEFVNTVKKHIEGQGSQIDVAGVLPKLLIAIAEWVDGMGDLAELDTDHKSDIVSAINEVADLVETPHFVISFTKSASELKEIYDECEKNLILAKNIVFYNSETDLYYKVNGYNMVNGLLKLHVLMSGVDTTINLSSWGALSIG